MKKTTWAIIILHMCTTNENHVIYGSWDSMSDKIFCHFGPFFALLPSLKKSKFWKTEKKTPGDIIILHKCTINDNHMMYGSWDMKHGRQNFLSFWTVFCSFTPLTTQKIKILKNWKKCLAISFYTSVQKIMIICYTVL